MNKITLKKIPKCWQASLSLEVIGASSRFWWLQAFLRLRMRHSKPCLHVPLPYSSLCCQISLCFYLIRTLVIGLRDHADNLEQSPHVEILKVKVKVLVAQSCLPLPQPNRVLCPGNSPGKKILEWAAIPFSRRSSQSRIEPESPALQEDSLLSEPPGKPVKILKLISVIKIHLSGNADSRD